MDNIKILKAQLNLVAKADIEEALGTRNLKKYKRDLILELIERLEC